MFPWADLLYLVHSVLRAGPAPFPFPALSGSPFSSSDLPSGGDRSARACGLLDDFPAKSLARAVVVSAGEFIRSEGVTN